MITAYVDCEVAIDAINNGAVYKYISKPWKIPELKRILEESYRFFQVQQQKGHASRKQMAEFKQQVISERIINLSGLAADMGYHVRNALQPVLTFLELLLELLLEERIQIERANNPEY